jgi:acetyl-CoA synthetase
MRRNGIKNVLLANGTSAVIWQKRCRRLFWFIGRADDIIKTSGHMVGPLEVESTLMRHPGGGKAVIESLSLRWGVGKSVCGFKNGREATDEMRMDILGFARKEMGPAVVERN